MTLRRRPSVGFTLIELLIVVALLGIFVGVAMPDANPRGNEQLQAVARMLKSDLAYARSLAITNNSTYRIEFEPKENRYTLEHAGSNAALDALPDSPFRNEGDPVDEHIVDLDELGPTGRTVRVAAVARIGSSATSVDDVEFGPLGETTRSGITAIWLATGRGKDVRYAVVRITAETGLATIEPITTVAEYESLLADSE